MASLFLLNLRIEQKPEYELMILNDARIIVVAQMFSDKKALKNFITK